MSHNQAQRPDLFEERGFGLISVILIACFVALIGTYAALMLTNSMKGNKSAQMTDELISVRRVLLDKVNCKNTLEKRSCPSKGGYFPLKDDNERTIGSDHGKYWKLGAWTLRASCDATEMTVEYARTDTQGSFLKDPFTKKVQGWKNLFEDSELSCSSSVQNLSGKSKSGASCNVNAGICPDQKRKSWKLITGDLDYDPNWDTADCSRAEWRHYSGIVRCPAGYKPSGGGGECNIPPWGGILVSSRLISPNSSFKLQDYSKSGYPWHTMYSNKSNAHGWYVDCCAPGPYSTSPDGGHPAAKAKDQIYVICVPDH